MMWNGPPGSVLVLRKQLDQNVISPFVKMVAWLVEEKALKVYVEKDDLSDTLLEESTQFKDVKNCLIPFQEGEDKANSVDFIICLGGDTTLLHASYLFQGRVPPVMAFNVGSRGFLAPFKFDEDFRQCVSEVMEGVPNVFLRYRLKCAIVGGDDRVHPAETSHEDCDRDRAQHLVLNEVVLNRGHSSTSSNFEIYIAGRLVTSVNGDGLIMSTPTGSTAYSVSAGASMVHPSVPCVLITPICPQSLSFRPIIVPAGVKIKIKLCSDSMESACMVSFDGRDRREMRQGESLEVTTSNHPLLSICSTNQTEDWFESLAMCLNWNLRRSQKSLVSPENSHHKSLNSKRQQMPKNIIGSTDSCMNAVSSEVSTVYRESSQDKETFNDKDYSDASEPSQNVPVTAAAGSQNGTVDSSKVEVSHNVLGMIEKDFSVVNSLNFDNNCMKCLEKSRKNELIQKSSRTKTNYSICQKYLEPLEVTCFSNEVPEKSFEYSDNECNVIGSRFTEQTVKPMGTTEVEICDINYLHSCHKNMEILCSRCNTVLSLTEKVPMKSSKTIDTNGNVVSSYIMDINDQSFGRLSRTYISESCQKPLNTSSIYTSTVTTLI